MITAHLPSVIAQPSVELSPSEVEVLNHMRQRLTRLEKACLQGSHLHYELFAYNFSVACDAILDELPGHIAGILRGEFRDFVPANTPERKELQRQALEILSDLRRAARPTAFRWFEGASRA